MTKLKMRLRIIAVVGVATIAATFVSLATTAAPAAAAVPGLEKRKAFSASDSTSVKSATAECPQGKVVVGAAFDVGAVGVVLDDLILNTTNVEVTAYEGFGGVSQSWFVTAVAFCANPLPGYELRKATTASDSTFEKAAVAVCSPGKRVLGAGGYLTGGQGTVVFDEILPDSDRVSVKAFEANGASANSWRVTAIAVCANPISMHIATGISPHNSDTKTVKAICGAGTEVISAAFDLVSSIGQVNVYGSMQMEPFESVANTGAAEDADGTSGSWTLVSYAICATP